jgi:hypothetical protein
MGFWDKLFGRGNEPISDEIRRARERHGIQIDEDQEKEELRREPDKQRKTDWELDRKDYDPWEELRHVRSNFWIGGWAAKRLHWRPATDKLREELEEVARKREEKEQEQWRQAETDPALKQKLEEVARKREEKERKRLEKEEQLRAKLKEKGEKW